MHGQMVGMPDSRFGKDCHERCCWQCAEDHVPAVKIMSEAMSQPRDDSATPVTTLKPFQRARTHRCLPALVSNGTRVRKETEKRRETEMRD